MLSGIIAALLLYAYCVDLRASRQFAGTCEEGLEGDGGDRRDQPGFRTIVDFRPRCLPA